MLTAGRTSTIFLAALLPTFLSITFLRPAGATSGHPSSIVREEAIRAGIPVALALAVAEVESGFSPTAVSPAGAVGLMQIMPATAEGEFGVARDDLFDARKNARIGTRFLARLLIQYDGNWDLALSHYNGGTITNGRPHGYTREYIIRVFRVMMRYLEPASREVETVQPVLPGSGREHASERPAATDLDDFMSGQLRIGG
jgi:soluble lytic murein transglycosylase-like protein